MSKYTTFAHLGLFLILSGCVLSKGNNRQQQSEKAAITITPVGQDLSFTLLKNQELRNSLAGSINEASSSFSFDVVRSPLRESAFQLLSEQSGDFTYTPSLNFIGEDFFTYTVKVNDVVSAQYTVRLVVRDGNLSPTAANDSAAVNRNSAVIINVLSNDVDPNNDPMSVFLRGSTPANGEAIVLGNDTILYRPNTNFAGNDSFTYTIFDPFGSYSVGTVSVTVVGANNPPVAVQDAASSAPGMAKSINVLANDYDLDNNTLSVSIQTPPGQGTASVDSNFNIIYTANSSSAGPDIFTYLLSDGNGGSASGQVNITISNTPNSPPVAFNDTATIDEDTTVFLTPLNNDLDPENNPLSLVSYTQGTNGGQVFMDQSAQRLSYTPPKDSTMTDTITYVVTDQIGGQAMATITVNITPVNDAPIALAGSYFSYPGQTLSAQFLGAFDPDGDPVTYSLINPPLVGAFNFSSQGTVNFVADRFFEGIDTVTYGASDPFGAQAPPNTIYLNSNYENVGLNYGDYSLLQDTITRDPVILGQNNAISAGTFDAFSQNLVEAKYILRNDSNKTLKIKRLALDNDALIIQGALVEELLLNPNEEVSFSLVLVPENLSNFTPQIINTGLQFIYEDQANNAAERMELTLRSEVLDLSPASTGSVPIRFYFISPSNDPNPNLASNEKIDMMLNELNSRFNDNGSVPVSFISAGAFNITDDLYYEFDDTNFAAFGNKFQNMAQAYRDPDVINIYIPKRIIGLTLGLAYVFGPIGSNSELQESYPHPILPPAQTNQWQDYFSSAIFSGTIFGLQSFYLKTISHEIGHLSGLRHTYESSTRAPANISTNFSLNNCGSGTNPISQPINIYSENSVPSNHPSAQNIMKYFIDTSPSSTFYNGEFRDPSFNIQQCFGLLSLYNRLR